MEDNTIINGLLKIRTETAEQVGYARKRLAELSHDLEAIEHVLTVMGHYERPPTPLAYAGQFSRGERRLLEPFSLTEQRTTDVRLAESIVLDLAGVT